MINLVERGPRPRSTGAGLLQQWQTPAIFACAFALYFLTRSPGLDEWDSVQLAFGVGEFNLWKHQPHPPGYPLYIFLGWSGQQLFGWDPNLSLHIASCLGGALFVATWFLIIRFHFGERFAWLIAISLAITPVVWMTSTKVLTDSLAAGLLSAQLYYSLLYRSSGSTKQLIISSLLGSATVGARPQLILVVVFILAFSLVKRRSGFRSWIISAACFLGACLFWLAPTCYLQSRLPGPVPGWLAYSAQLYSQWSWRLDRPDVYVGGGRFTLGYISLRFVTHILGWFGVGLGLLHSIFALVAGGLFVIAGAVASLTHIRDQDREFWRSHRSWAGLHTAIIFCFLPADQRYYLIIMPLLLVLLLRGFTETTLPAASLFLPALLLGISIPCAIENHRQEAPPIQAIQYLQRRHPFEERSRVLVFLTRSRRHFGWYAPEFTAFHDTAFASVNSAQLVRARAIYTEDTAIVLSPEWQLVPIMEFHRSVVIYRKHHDLRLFRIEKTTAP